MSLLWVVNTLVVPVIISFGTGIYAGFLVGRILSFQQDKVRASQRIDSIPDRMERVALAEDETTAQQVFQFFFQDIARALMHSGQKRAARDLTLISLALQEKVLAFWHHKQRQLEHGVATAKIAADFRRFTIEAVDAVSTDVGIINPQWDVLILGSWNPPSGESSGAEI